MEILLKTLVPILLLVAAPAAHAPAVTEARAASNAN